MKCKFCDPGDVYWKKLVPPPYSYCSDDEKISCPEEIEDEREGGYDWMEDEDEYGIEKIKNYDGWVS